jgi:hypothetical protein
MNTPISTGTPNECQCIRQSIGGNKFLLIDYGWGYHCPVHGTSYTEVNAAMRRSGMGGSKSIEWHPGMGGSNKEVEVSNDIIVETITREDEIKDYRHANCHSCGQMVKRIEPNAKLTVKRYKQALEHTKTVGKISLRFGKELIKLPFRVSWFLLKQLVSKKNWQAVGNGLVWVKDGLPFIKHWKIFTTKYWFETITIDARPYNTRRSIEVTAYSIIVSFLIAVGWLLRKLIVE